ncbi:MAG: hypothetical protein DIZ77_05460 [endosymbiont of Seepiophila jonesi]|uniref:Uncharacterized protein n=1 Tax=endosymbiont of Lamellibrachia luymesi TaxID=2200907 RepID=A0A370DUC7_9GAMM|nr:MAG: hypothetical protein DIZ79_13855 [endosymbiont of Lamellibrachia luymesi]RDH93644.1 MAG: hypothetical protein DIZ77_05460 [endosymbiont of Seepiophila jonesi]
MNYSKWPSILIAGSLALLPAAIPAQSAHHHARHVDGHATQNNGNKTGPEFHKGLNVERLLIKQPTAKGVDIKLSYRIVEVEELPAHPMATFIITEEREAENEKHLEQNESKETERKEITEFVKPDRLQMIAMSVSVEKAAETPASKLTFWDKKGLVTPGKPVVVAVAGLEQHDIVPKKGAGYIPGGALKAERLKAELEKPPAGASLDVIDAKLSGNGGLLNVQSRSKGIKSMDTAGKNTYVLDPTTGNRYSVLRVPRLGMMAPKDLGRLGSSFMVIHNRNNEIKAGQRVSVVVAGARQDNILILEN